MIDQATQHAIALAKDRGHTEVAADDLLLGSLLAVSRFGVALIGPLVIELEGLGVEWMTPPRERGKVAYSAGAVAVFERAARIVQAEGGGPLGIEHLLAAFAAEDTGLMAAIKSRLGISGADWRAAVARFAADQRADQRTDQRTAAQSAQERAAASSRQREYLTPEEAADVLGIHVQTLRGYIRNGKLQALRLAGERSLRIRRSDLESLLEPLAPS